MSDLYGFLLADLAARLRGDVGKRLLGVGLANSTFQIQRLHCLRALLGPRLESTNLSPFESTLPNIPWGP